MPALAILLSLGEVQGDSEGDMVAFVSGLLLGNDQTIRYESTVLNVPLSLHWKIISETGLHCSSVQGRRGKAKPPAMLCNN